MNKNEEFVKSRYPDAIVDDLKGYYRTHFQVRENTTGACISWSGNSAENAWKNSANKIKKEEKLPHFTPLELDNFCQELAEANGFIYEYASLLPKGAFVFLDIHCLERVGGKRHIIKMTFDEHSVKHKSCRVI